MGTRWKGKGSKAKALAEPMSKIVSQLQSSLTQTESCGLLSGCSVLLEAGEGQTELLNRACFGRPIVTAEKDRQWFQLSLEEAFFLCHSLKCLKILGDDKCLKNEGEVWLCMKSRSERFPDFYKAYSHLRTKNWVVRSGSQYGVDYVAYCHHPSLVHSQFAVLVLSQVNPDANGRLRLWSDIHCSIRLCGSVAKTLLVLDINRNGQTAFSLSYLDLCTVEERTITRWNPEQCREEQIKVENVTE